MADGAGHDNTPLAFLRDKMEVACSGAVLAQQIADDAWVDYDRRSNAARDAWRAHAALVEAVRLLEAGRRG